MRMWICCLVISGACGAPCEPSKTPIGSRPAADAGPATTVRVADAAPGATIDCCQRIRDCEHRTATHDDYLACIGALETTEPACAPTVKSLAKNLDDCAVQR